MFLGVTSSTRKRDVGQLRWHKMVKEALKKIGENRGYDVSESEKEMFLVSQRFSEYDFSLIGKGSEIKDYGKATREPHIFSYKPDGVWKKGHIYRAIFEIEHLKARKRSAMMTKRKYSIGSFMLGYLAYLQKSARYFVFITDNIDLYREIVTFKKLLPLKHSKKIHELCIGKLTGKLIEPIKQPSNIMIALQETIIKKLKI